MTSAKSAPSASAPTARVPMRSSTGTSAAHQRSGDIGPVGAMIIGAQKSGTTSLARQLATHPQVCFCDDKEPGYFNTVTDWKSGLTHYHQMFDPQPGQLMVEASTMYTFFPEFIGTHSRLAEYNPDLRLVYVMREPVDRMVSNYAHRVARRLTTRDMMTDFATDAFYANRSHYAAQLRLYLSVFPRHQLLPVIFEEYVREPIGALTQIAEFLGIDPEPLRQVDTSPRHVSTSTVGLTAQGKRLRQLLAPALPMLPSAVRDRFGKRFRYGLESKPQLDQGQRDVLSTLFVDDIAYVEALLGRPVPTWHR